MDEFALIDALVRQLGGRAAGGWVQLGPGDDACVVSAQPGRELVASIDTLLADVHFPAAAPAELIGYRALMVALSDLAAMAATPRYVLVALSLPSADNAWINALARGMADAAETCDVYICGGNLCRGPLSISVSVHGDCAAGAAVTRAGARPGDTVYVSGALGGAAACVKAGEFTPAEPLSARQRSYFRPLARFDVGEQLRSASAAIDISDGLLADLGHLARASAVDISITSGRVPVHSQAALEDALQGGDDYEILCTSAGPMAGFTAVGEVAAAAGGTPRVLLDGQPAAGGYKHFT